MALPPIPTPLLNSSPLFTNLIQDLTQNHLTPTLGTLPSTEELEKDAALEQELRVQAAVIAKGKLLGYRIAFGGLPEEITTLLSLHLHPMKDAEGAHIPPLPEVIPLSFPAPPVPLLPKDLALERAPAVISMRMQKLHPPSAQALLSALSSVSKSHSELLQHLAGLLTTLRPSQTPHLHSHSAFLHSLTRGLRGKLLVLQHTILSSIYGTRGGGKSALVNYRNHLVDTRTRLVARKRVVEEELRRYERVEGMRGVVEEYARVGRRCEGLRGEIRKLGGEV